jgi:RNA polymerase sigma-70 factor (ECF subfamily)
MESSTQPERALLAGARNLEARALAQIHDQYYPEIYRYALYRTSDQALAEDIAGEVFLRLLDSLHKGRAPQTTLRGWLFGVASNLVVDHFRRSPRESTALDDDLPEAESSAGRAEQNLQRQAVGAAIRQLTAEQQETLALRFGDGFSVEQTAEVMGKSVTAVKALQFRALAMLRKMLGEVPHDG